jgi:hypothetical protein
VLELENEAGPVPIIYKWPWPWPSAAAVGPHRSRPRFPDFDSQKSHLRNVAPPFFPLGLARSRLLFGGNSRKKCISSVRTMPDPDFLGGLGTSDAAATSVSSRRYWERRVISWNGALNDSRLVNDVQTGLGCTEHWSFSGRCPGRKKGGWIRKKDGGVCSERCFLHERCSGVPSSV